MDFVYPWDDLANDYLFDQGTQIAAGTYGKVARVARNRTREFRGRTKLAVGDEIRAPNIVAIKYFKSRDVNDADVLNKLRGFFGAEARALLEIRHKSIVWAYAFYEGAEGSALVMEYLEGGMLLETIGAFECFNEHDVRKIIFPLLLALAHCQEMKLVHRDIKPENILLRKPVDVPAFMTYAERRAERLAAGNMFSTLNENGRLEVVLADFGFVTSDVRGRGRIGSRRFMAPEVLTLPRSFEKDWAKADIWSLGSVLFLMLSGGHVYLLDDQIRGLMNGHVIEFVPPSKRTELAHVSDQAKEFLDKMLTVDPERRWSARELYDERNKWRDMKKEIAKANQIQTRAIEDYLALPLWEAGEFHEAADRPRLDHHAQNENVLVPLNNGGGHSNYEHDMEL